MNLQTKNWEFLKWSAGQKNRTQAQMETEKNKLQRTKKCAQYVWEMFFYLEYIFWIGFDPTWF